MKPQKRRAIKREASDSAPDEDEVSVLSSDPDSATAETKPTSWKGSIRATTSFPAQKKAGSPVYVDGPSPAELFKMYFDRAAVKRLCANTNKNAAKNIAAGRKLKWTELTEAELYRYIGLTLYMGLLKLPKVRDFWRASSIFHVRYPAEVMSRDRVLAISWNLHLSNPAEDALNDSRKGTDDYDCLHRIRAPVRQLTRYTVDFNIYTGRSALLTGKGLSFDAVVSLVNKSYLGSGYHIYCDSFYTSPVLFLHLYDLRFGACGMFQDTRVGIPKGSANALTKKSPQGTVRWIREGALIFIKWMDMRQLSVCSTIHTAFSGDTMKKKKRARKSRKWCVTVLHHFIDIAVTNSYLLSKELSSGLKQQPMTHQAFQEQLTAELCGVPLQMVPESYQHVPVAIVEGASGQKKATQGCRMCTKSTPFMCEACKVPVCVIVDRNCHKAFHSPTPAPKSEA
ncbi:piggyBac transposable element-derived protein 4-like [Archocentrus centrarchus]|uniref:piggyBac transposable element-derived protein 4-like n=1 Tax=Archocentrus centrarchus TaxID=63155 RepID=UPI0011EA36D8|nr:piggyBac transposable element-derived protein 4-like [Archocentrus centrarchus]